MSVAAKETGRLYPIFQQLIAAWQAGDVETVLSLMDEDIVWHFAAGALPPARGKAAAARLLGRLGADMHAIQWRVFAHAEAGDRLFVEGVDDYTTAAGRRVAAPYAGVLEFRDGRVTGWRDYVDTGVIARQRDGEALTAQVEELIGRPAL